MGKSSADGTLLRLIAELEEALAPYGATVRALARAASTNPHIARQFAAIVAVHSDVLEIPTMPHYDGVVRLLEAMFSQVTHREDLPERAALIELYRQSDHFYRLMEPLNPRYRTIIILRRGLIDGSLWTLEEVGERFQISPSSVQNKDKKALEQLRRSDERRRFRTARIEGLGYVFDIGVLDLPARILTLLRKANIKLIDDLVTKTRRQILGITGMSPLFVDQIETELENYGLSLAPAS